MGLFDEQVAEVERFLSNERTAGRVREFRGGSRPDWLSEQSLVLEEDTAIELGNPSVASLSFLVWSEEPVDDGRISLVGPDVSEMDARGVPFAQVIEVSGEFTDEYESYRNVREAVYNTALGGFMVRTMPSRQSIWCRIGRDAVSRGFSLQDLGAALIRNLDEVPSVTGAEVLFVTSSVSDVRRLETAGSGTRRIIEALMKMYEEKNFDCETCEYKDVCYTVTDLKKIRKKLTGEEAG